MRMARKIAASSTMTEFGYAMNILKLVTPSWRIACHMSASVPSSTWVVMT